eukprot:766683-Hanusia_phi.AAC.13
MSPIELIPVGVVEPMYPHVIHQMKAHHRGTIHSIHQLFREGLGDLGVGVLQIQKLHFLKKSVYPTPTHWTQPYPPPFGPPPTLTCARVLHTAGVHRAVSIKVPNPNP